MRRRPLTGESEAPRHASAEHGVLSHDAQLVLHEIARPQIGEQKNDPARTVVDAMFATLFGIEPANRRRLRGIDPFAIAHHVQSMKDATLAAWVERDLDFRALFDSGRRRDLADAMHVVLQRGRHAKLIFHEHVDDPRLASCRGRRRRDRQPLDPTRDGSERDIARHRCREPSPLKEEKHKHRQRDPEQGPTERSHGADM